MGPDGPLIHVWLVFHPRRNHLQKNSPSYIDPQRVPVLAISVTDLGQITKAPPGDILWADQRTTSNSITCMIFFNTNSRESP